MSLKYLRAAGLLPITSLICSPGLRNVFTSLFAESNPSNVLPLTVVTRTASGETSLEILPHPTILRVSPRTVALFESTNIKVGIDDYQVSGISAAYTEAQLTGKGKYYIVDGSIKCNEVMGTIENKSFSWEIILTRMPNR